MLLAGLLVFGPFDLDNLVKAAMISQIGAVVTRVTEMECGTVPVLALVDVALDGRFMAVHALL